MKKLFALFMVVAMLSVAGTAMAVTVTASPSDVSVTLGSTATSTISATAAHGGTLSYSLSSTAPWATLSGTTVTFSPSSSAATGYFTVTVTATETFTSGDVAGHSTTVTESATANIYVTVSKAVTPKPEGGSSSATTQTKVLTTVVTVTVKVINVAVATMPTFQQMTAAPTATVSSGISSGLTSIASTIARLLGMTSITTTTIQTGANLEEAATETYTAGDNEGNLKNAAARMRQKSDGDTKRVIGVPAPFKPKASGMQPIPLPKFDESMYGRKPGIDMGKTPVAGSFFAATDDGGNEVVFLDSNGMSTDVIPGVSSLDGAPEAGVLTAVAYVEAGATYEPIIFTEISTADAAAFDTATGTTEEGVEVTVTETVTVKATDTFNPAVDEAIIELISAAYGKTLTHLPYDAAGDGWEATAAEKTYMTANNLVYVCSLPPLTNIPDGAYIAEITFDNTPTGTNVGVPTFYPNGVSATGAAASKVYVYTGSTQSPVEVTAALAKTYVSQNTLAYLVFEVVNGAVTTSDFEDAAVSLSEPSIVVTSTTSTSGDIRGVGGSSGGCSAGSAVLALAVLGSFVLTRKK